MITHGNRALIPVQTCCNLTMKVQSAPVGSIAVVLWTEKMTAHWVTTERVASIEADLNAKIDRRRGEPERTMERRRAEERSRAELVQWTLLIWLAEIVLTVGAK